VLAINGVGCYVRTVKWQEAFNGFQFILRYYVEGRITFWSTLVQYNPIFGTKLFKNLSLKKKGSHNKKALNTTVFNRVQM
jgi:hypothetical protein